MDLLQSGEGAKNKFRNFSKGKKLNWQLSPSLEIRIAAPSCSAETIWWTRLRTIFRKLIDEWMQILNKSPTICFYTSLVLTHFNTISFIIVITQQNKIQLLAVHWGCITAPAVTLPFCFTKSIKSSLTAVPT